MTPRRCVQVALLSSVVALGAPAGAERAICRDITANTGGTGAVSVTCVEDTAALTAHCAFDILLTPTGRVPVVFGGSATAVGSQVPQQTRIRCEIRNDWGDAAACEFTNAGATTACVETARFGVAPVTVCVTAVAGWAPAASVPYTCAETTET